jgi:hypothetical protein
LGVSPESIEIFKQEKIITIDDELENIRNIPNN